MRSLRSYLVATTTLLVALVFLGAGLVVWDAQTFARTQTESELRHTARTMALAVDAEVRSFDALLRALAASPAAEAGDWAKLDRQARRLLPGPDAWIVAGDRAGQQVLNTRLPPGATLPGGRPAPAEAWAALDRGSSHVCNLTQGRIERRILCVDEPLSRAGAPRYHLSAVFRPAYLQKLLGPLGSGEGRFVSVIDRAGVVAWRSRSPERWIGRAASPELVRAMRSEPEGVLVLRSFEGVPTLFAFARAPFSGWTTVVAVPEAGISALGQRALLYGAAGALLLLATGVGCGLAAGRRVGAALGHLGAVTERLARGEPAAFEPSGFEEIDRVGSALAQAIAERDLSRERFDLAQEAGGIGAWDWDLVQDRGVVTDSYRRMHGLPPGREALSFADVLAVIHPEDLEGYRARLGRALGRFELSTNEYRVRHPDGSVRWIAARGRPLRGPDGRAETAIGIVTDVTARKAAEARLGLLVREVDHRANNLMAVAQSIVSLTRAEDVDAFRKLVAGRIQALARAHKLLAASRWSGADLRRLALEEMAPFTIGDAERVRLTGPPVALPPEAGQAVAMVLHELATNAAKHGALSTETGRVDLHWRVEPGRLALVWRETGGPPVRAPARRGFGTTVLRRAVEGSIGGSTRLAWLEAGLVCEIEVPLDDAAAAAPADAAVPEPAAPDVG